MYGGENNSIYLIGLMLSIKLVTTLTCLEKRLVHSNNYGRLKIFIVNVI